MAHKADVEIFGHGVYTVSGNTDAGLDWITENVYWEQWQGTPETGLIVYVSGRRYIGNGKVAA